MFIPIYLRLEGKVPPPPQDWHWTKHECYRKQIISCEVSKCILQSTPPLPSPDFMPEKKTCEFQFQMGIWKSEFQVTVILELGDVHFWITFDFWWLARLVDGLEPHPPPLSSPEKWNAPFWIMFNFWWSAGLVSGLKPHLPPLSSPEKWNAHFWITFNFWWLAGLVDGLEPHLPPLSSPVK